VPKSWHIRAVPYRWGRGKYFAIAKFGQPLHVSSSSDIETIFLRSSDSREEIGRATRSIFFTAQTLKFIAAPVGDSPDELLPLNL
jgi:hypothetical protein